MAKKAKSAQRRTNKTDKPTHHKIMYFMNIAFLIGIIALTVYDVSKGNSIFDHTSGKSVLSEKDEVPIVTPSPTLLPELR